MEQVLFKDKTENIATRNIFEEISSMKEDILEIKNELKNLKALIHHAELLSESNNHYSDENAVFFGEY